MSAITHIGLAPQTAAHLPDRPSHCTPRRSLCESHTQRHRSCAASANRCRRTVPPCRTDASTPCQRCQRVHVVTLHEVAGSSRHHRLAFIRPSCTHCGRGAHLPLLSALRQDLRTSWTTPIGSLTLMRVARDGAVRGSRWRHRTPSSR